MYIAMESVVLIRSVVLVHIVVTLGCSSLGHNAKNVQNGEIEQSHSGEKRPTGSDAFARQANYSKSSDESMSTTIVSMFERMADAARIKPRVIPASDPTKLATKHEDLGPEVYIAAARLQEKHGNQAKALDLYNRARQVAPDESRVSIALARYHVSQERFTDALSVYEDALRKDANNATLHNDIGICYARMRNVDKAIVSFSKACDLQRENLRYRNNLAEALVDGGLAADALDQLRQCYDEATANYQIGRLLERNGDLHEASAYLARSLAVNPQFADARELMHRVNIRLAGRPSTSRINETIRPVGFELTISDMQDYGGRANAQSVERIRFETLVVEPPQLIPVAARPPLAPSPEDTARINL